MAANTPRVRVVEIDGLHFRIQKLRGRRSLRGARVVQKVLGFKALLLMQRPEFWEAEEANQVSSLSALAETAAATADDWEDGIRELLTWQTGHGGQGVSFRSDGNTVAEAPGWQPIRDTSSLDPYDVVDYQTWLAVAWEMVKLCYLPTGAAGGTSPGTPAADTTSTEESSPSGEAPNQKPGRRSAPPKVNVSGISGG